MDILSFIGSAATAGAMIMTRMIPLRLMIIVGNLFFIIDGVLFRDFKLAGLHIVLLLVNVYRLRQMQLLVKKVVTASQGVISEKWLTTFMRRKPAAAGESLFSRGDPATHLFYIVSGRFWIPELNLEIEPGKLVGELGILMPERTRSQSLECRESGELLIISYDEVHELFFQNPEFGYHFLRLVAARLLKDVERLQIELGERRSAPL